MAGPFRQTRKRLRLLKTRFTMRRFLAGRKTVQLEIGAGEKRGNDFAAPRLRPFDPSIDLAWRQHESIYAEAYKPAA